MSRKKLESFLQNQTLEHSVIRERCNNSGRLAFRWDGFSRTALESFVGPYAQYRFHRNGDAIVTVGYGSLHLKPGYYIWDDSDGYDSGSPEQLQEQFEIIKHGGPGTLR